MPEILTAEAVEFVGDLQRRFGAHRTDLLAQRGVRRAETARTGRLDFLVETADVRAADWRVPPPVHDLTNRRVEITGGICREVFDAALGERHYQLDLVRDRVSVTAEQLLDFAATPGDVTTKGLRSNVSVALQYLESWLGGNGAVAINNLMEDAATAEISRAQIWQWVHREVVLADGGETVTADLVRRITGEDLDRVREQIGAQAFAAGRYADARALFEQVALADEFVDFLTVPAYDSID